MIVTTAASGQEAIDFCGEKSFDIIFMDHMMPGMDGIETYKKSLEDSENLNLDTPMIMMTANALNGVREEYLEMGFTDYLSKPLDTNELRKVLKRNLPFGKISPRPDGNAVNKQR